MKKCNADKLVMLISADWFIDYWSFIGLTTDPIKKRKLQHDCQSIVKSFMNGSIEYWSISFLESRTSDTCNQFLDAVRSINLGHDQLSHVENLLTQPGHIPSNTSSLWLYSSINEMLVTEGIDSEIYEVKPLEEDVKNTLIRLWRAAETENPNFEDLCMKSVSVWDKYLRQSTPDLPTLLADYLTGEIIVRDSFLIFWEKVSATVSVKKKESIIEWYNNIAYALTGEKPQPLGL